MVILVGIVFLSGVNYQNINQTFNQSTTPVMVSHVSPSDPKIKAKFDEIANIPYDEVNYNCLNKSEDFADFLLLKNTSDVNIVILEGSQYSHVCVLWDGLIYDPTNTPPLYGVDQNKYYKALNNLGYTTILTSPYSQEWKQQNEEYNKINFSSVKTTNAVVQKYLQDAPTNVKL